jgi:methylmalonyl-CoA mutase cobalamin-binding domain/chain
MRLKDLEIAVLEQDAESFNSAIKAAIDNGVESIEIRRSILRGLDQIRRKLMSNETSLPELLISLDITSGGLETLFSKRGISPVEDPISLVIGVVEGDPHDLGKNIIAQIYKSFGYQVCDLGVQVPKELFVKTVKEKNARVLALSAMMSTTMTAMPEIIQEVRAISPDTVILAGGAPLDEVLAESYGADGYAESAVTVLEETEKAIGKTN